MQPFPQSCRRRKPRIPPPIPIEQFFKKPSATGAAMSPNGRFVALRKLSPQGRAALSIVDVETRQARSIASFGNADVENFFWLNDQRLAFTVINVDHDGDAGKPGLYAIDRDGGNRVFLTDTFVRRRSFAEGDDVSQAYLAESTLHGFPLQTSDDIFVIEHFDDSLTLTRMSSRTGRLSTSKTPRNTFSWLVDPSGVVRIAVAQQDEHSVVHYRDSADQWREIARYDPVTEKGFEPLLYVGGALYVRSRNGSDTAAVYRYDLEKNAIAPTPLIVAPGFDVNGYFLVDDKKMLGFRFATDAQVTVWFDETMKAIQQEVDQLLPGTVNTLSRGRHSETPYVLIDAHSDVQDHVYLLFNRETKRRTLLGEARPDIEPEQMAPMSFVRYKARDGLQIPAYLTLPKVPVKKNLPTVVLVGDSPWYRNGMWQWDGEVQFLASRGYAVLRPNPRGTAGFGQHHLNAGDKQWGRAMQDDIADGVKWAVAEGIADPARVCIAGTGYGGYAAMMGLIKDSELFKCGVNWSGITDIASMFSRDWDEFAEYRAMDQIRRIVGDPAKDSAQFKETSPLENAARIKRPLLLAYGKDDSRIPYSHGRKLYEALSASKAPVEWLTYAPTVADWRTQKNRIDLWNHIEAFLARNIGPQ